MSRGRGGGRGRGRGRGGGPGAQIPGGLSSAQFDEALREVPKHTGMLYPSNTPILKAPSTFESSLIHESSLLHDILQKGVPPEAQGGGGWRLFSERKVVGIEIESYSDRFRPKTDSTPGTTLLNREMLHLDENMFPPGLWKGYFEGEGEKVKSKRKRRVDDDGELEEDPLRDDDDPDKSAAGSDVEEGDEFEDESDNQDYEQNYFDNGEDEDEGGEEGDGEGGDTFNNDD